MKQFKKNRQALDFLILAGTVGITSILALTFLPKKITISPLVIFGIIFLSNIATILVPEDVRGNSTGVFSRFFFARLALSTVFAVLLILIFNFAQRL